MAVKMKVREQYLLEMADKIRPRIEKITGIMTPKFHISVGFPSRNALSMKRRTIGQCWDGLVSQNGQFQIFISPVIGSAIEVAATVAHELIHANVGTKAGHKKPFADTARAIGLAGKPTQTYAGEDFRAFADPIIGKLGDYPHSQLVPTVGFKPQTTRLIKAWCTDCGYIVRTTEKWLELGTPLCPCNQKSMKSALD